MHNLLSDFWGWQEWAEGYGGGSGHFASSSSSEPRRQAMAPQTTGSALSCRICRGQIWLRANESEHLPGQAFAEQCTGGPKLMVGTETAAQAVSIVAAGYEYNGRDVKCFSAGSRTPSHFQQSLTPSEQHANAAEGRSLIRAMKRAAPKLLTWTCPHPPSSKSAKRTPCLLATAPTWFIICVVS